MVICRNWQANDTLSKEHLQYVATLRQISGDPRPTLPPPDAGLTDNSLPHLAHLERHDIVMIKLSIADYGVHQVA